jgi:hypothetical protein
MVFGFRGDKYDSITIIAQTSTAVSDKALHNFPYLATSCASIMRPSFTLQSMLHQMLVYGKGDNPVTISNYALPETGIYYVFLIPSGAGTLKSNCRVDVTLAKN